MYFRGSKKQEAESQKSSQSSILFWQKYMINSIK